MKIAERYFLGELTDSEAEAFEAHYFECPTCAEYVREEMAMIEAGREVAKEPNANEEPQPKDETQAKVIPFPPRRWDWLSAAAAAMLTLVVATPILRYREPSIELGRSAFVPFSADRATAPEPLIFEEGESITLDFDIPPADVPRYVVSVRDASNDVVDEEHELTSTQANETQSLVLTALPAGTYKVVIEGVSEKGNRSFVASQPFEVRGKSQGGRP